MLEGDQPTLPDPARCLLAIREARTALAKNPDDWVAYRLLDVAYRFLVQRRPPSLPAFRSTARTRPGDARWYPISISSPPASSSASRP